MRHASARELAVSTEAMLPAWDGFVRNCCVYDNIAATRPDFARMMRRSVYADRTVTLDGVDLCRLPAGAVLTGGDEFLVRCGDVLLGEQIGPPLMQEAGAERLRELVRPGREVVQVAGEVLLVARFGLATWGHWLGELLPRFVLAEAQWPGRFRYALPTEVLFWQRYHPTFKAIRDSLHAHGVDDSRIFAFDVARDHVFEALHAVTPVWSERLIHPGALRLMREAMPRRATDGPRRVALLRTDAPGRRQVANFDAVLAWLQARGFELAAPGTMSFADQVALFRDAREIVSVLGSGLTGLIYAPAGVRVLAMAPDVFGDWFFYALTAMRDGLWADIRGPVVEPHPQSPHLSSFTVDLNEVERGLAALGEGRPKAADYAARMAPTPG